MSVTKGNVVTLPNGYAGDMLSCLDAQTTINEGVDNPQCKSLLVDIDSSDDPQNPYKNAEVNGMACSTSSVRSKSNDYSHDLTCEQAISKNRNHTKYEDRLPVHHNFLQRHHSHPNPNQSQNHYIHYPKRHQSLRQQQRKTDDTHIEAKVADSGDHRHHATPQTHICDSSIHPSPSKVPLLSSPTSEDTPEEDEFYSSQQSKRRLEEEVEERGDEEEAGKSTTVNGLIPECSDASNIPLKSMRNLGACPKYINLASNPAYLNSTILDENNCWPIFCIWSMLNWLSRWIVTVKKR